MNTIAHVTQPDYGKAIEVLNVEMQRLGYERICPEGLIALKEEADEDGWVSNTIRAAYYVTMDGFRKLFGVS